MSIRISQAVARRAAFAGGSHYEAIRDLSERVFASLTKLSTGAKVGGEAATGFRLSASCSGIPCDNATSCMGMGDDLCTTPDPNEDCPEDYTVPSHPAENCWYLYDEELEEFAGECCDCIEEVGGYLDYDACVCSGSIIN